MNVEQTTQLIQLILNSALMVVGSAILLGSMILRQGQLAARPAAESRPAGAMNEVDRSAKNLLKRQTTFTQRSILMMAYASGGFMVSMLILVFRTFIEFNGLIPFSLALFCLSTVALFAGVTMLLFSLHLPSRRTKLEAKPDVDERPVESPPPLVRPVESRRRSGTVLRMSDGLGPAGGHRV
jgi:hypothetical protein